MTSQSTHPPPGTWNARNLLTVLEEAEWARVQPKTVYRWIKEGKLEAIQFGPRTFRVPEDAIGKFLHKTGYSKTTPELQSQVKARDQAVDLVSRGLPGQPPRRRALPALTQPPSNPLLGNVRVVEPDEVKDWISDVLPRIQQKALQEGEDDDV